MRRLLGDGWETHRERWRVLSMCATYGCVPDALLDEDWHRLVDDHAMLLAKQQIEEQNMTWRPPMGGRRG